MGIIIFFRMRIQYFSGFMALVATTVQAIGTYDEGLVMSQADNEVDIDAENNLDDLPFETDDDSMAQIDGEGEGSTELDTKSDVDADADADLSTDISTDIETDTEAEKKPVKKLVKKDDKKSDKKTKKPKKSKK